MDVRKISELFVNSKLKAHSLLPPNHVLSRSKFKTTPSPSKIRDNMDKNVAALLCKALEKDGKKEKDKAPKRLFERSDDSSTP